MPSSQCLIKWSRLLEGLAASYTGEKQDVHGGTSSCDGGVLRQQEQVESWFILIRQVM
jgi:hypothetical protein